MTYCPTDRLAYLGRSVLGILLKAKQVGLLGPIRPEVERLRQQGFSISPSFMLENPNIPDATIQLTHRNSSKARTRNGDSSDLHEG
ncbi:MAG: DUF3368 domain-containing protein [Caldilinea sp. CFX5]|nr:DUF3368 domain-containing protein [Caldilinea sp. CFX5]